MVTEFFAVTLTSVYRVVAKGDYRSTATKIALRGSSKLPVGTDLGEGKYYMIGVGVVLQAFVPEKYGSLHPMTGYERDYVAISTEWWGRSSSPIVALFLTEAEATACLESPDLQRADPRWLDSTRRVLAEIGDDHESFFVTHHRDLGLLENAGKVGMMA